MKSIFLMAILLALPCYGIAQDKGDPTKAKTGTTFRTDTVAPVDVQPEYPGGLQAFYTFVNKNFKPPKVKENMAVRIMVTFVIETDGSMSNFVVTRDLGFGLGDEAIRVLKLVKEKWTPGMTGGKPARASFALPITFNIKK